MDILTELADMTMRNLDDLTDATGLDALAAATGLGALMRGLQAAAVQSARDEGATWEQIGQALGITRQGAQLAYTRAVQAQEAHVPAAAVADCQDLGPDLGMMIRALSADAVRDVLLTLADRHPRLAARALSDCARTWEPGGADIAVVIDQGWAGAIG
jgi:hypothetical protein